MDSEFSKSHIVALTAYSVDMISDKCRESGMDDFLTKPVSTDSVKDIIARILWIKLNGHMILK